MRFFKWWVACLLAAMFLAGLGLCPRAAFADIETGLVAHYKLDEITGVTTRDDSGNAFHGYLEGNPVWTSGQKDGALELNGSSSYVDVPGLNITGLTQYTLSTWVRVIPNGTHTVTFMGKGRYVYPFALQVEQDSLSVKSILRTGNGTNYLYANSALEAGQWHHVALVYDGASQALYLDGVLDASTAASGTPRLNPDHFYLGGQPENGDFFSGALDDARIYNRALSALDVEELFSSEPAPPPPPPPPSYGYFVDFAEGSDLNDGRSPETPWKHAPGDPQATGNPAGTDLEPGDIVRFKGGVVYKGMLHVLWSGEPEKRIVYDGNSADTWGTGRAIIDGEGSTLGRSARTHAFYGAASYKTGSPEGQSHILIDHFEIRNLRYVHGELNATSSIGIQLLGSSNDVEIRNCNMHHLYPVFRAVLREGELGEGDNPGTSLGTASFTDIDVDFSPYATDSTADMAGFKILLGWNYDDYQKAWGYLGEASGNTITVYKDLSMTQPGWNVDRGSPYDHDGQYFYRIFDMWEGAWHLKAAFGIQVNGASNLRIHNNTIKHAKVGILSGSMTDSPAIGIQIYNNDISEVSWGIQASGSANSYVRDLKIVRNTIHDFYPFVKDNWGWHNDGMIIWGDFYGNGNGLEDIEIAGNYFYGDFRPLVTALIYMQYQMANVKIYNNIFATTAGHGYQLRLNTGMIDGVGVYNNTFAGIAGESMNSINMSAVSNVEFYNNLFWGYTSYAALYSVTSTDVQYFDSDYNLLASFNHADGDIYYLNSAYSLVDNTKYPYWLSETTYDQNSLIAQDPDFHNFPLFAAKITQAGTRSRLYLPEIPSTYPSSEFVQGEFIEYNHDGSSRRVTYVAPDQSYIEISPMLPEPSQPGDVLRYWGPSQSCITDLRLRSASPAINRGRDLSHLIPPFSPEDVPRQKGWDIGAYEQGAPVVRDPMLDPDMTGSEHWTLFR